MSESSNFDSSRSSAAESSIDEDGFYESEEEELEDFVPTPYLFTLKDPLGNSLYLSGERVQNARIICPPFHRLLDHAVAVLWILYSQKNLEKLDSSGIHWALKFLEGAESSQGVQSPDVRIAIDHLQEALVSITAEIDEENDMWYDAPEDEERDFFSPALEGENIPEYDDFKAGLGRGNKDSTKIDISKGLPSIILAELLGNQEEIQKLLQESFRNVDDACPVSIESDEKAKKKRARKETIYDALYDENELDFEDLIKWRNKQIEKAILQLEEIKNLDEKLKEMKERSGAAEEMKDLIVALKKAASD